MTYQRMKIVDCPINPIHILSCSIFLIEADNVIPGIGLLNTYGLKRIMVGPHQAGISIPPLMVTGKLGAVGHITWSKGYIKIETPAWSDKELLMMHTARTQSCQVYSFSSPLFFAHTANKASLSYFDSIVTVTNFPFSSLLCQFYIPT